MMRTLCAILVAITMAACGWARASSLSAPVAAGSEFDYRLHHSAGGRFITRDVLATSGDLPLADVLRSHIVGFGDTRDARAYSGMPACGMDVYLNGLRIIGNLDAIRSNDLVGVEYYQAATAPVKYRRAMSSCPVLLLWSKR
jgi:hypothetical protein